MKGKTCKRYSRLNYTAPVVTKFMNLRSVVDEAAAYGHVNHKITTTGRRRNIYDTVNARYSDVTGKVLAIAGFIPEK